MVKLTPEDRLRRAVENQKLRGSLVEDIEELADTDDLQERIDRLQALLDAREEALEGIETWTEAEGREDKADAKEEALEAVEAFVDALDALEADGTESDTSFDALDRRYPPDTDIDNVAAELSHEDIMAWKVRNAPERYAEQIAAWHQKREWNDEALLLYPDDMAAATAHYAKLAGLQTDDPPGAPHLSNPPGPQEIVAYEEWLAEQAEQAEAKS